MASAFQTIGLIGRANNTAVDETLNQLIKYLKCIDQPFVLDIETAQRINFKQSSTCPRQQLGSNCDLLIVVGGDGSLIRAAHLVIDNEIPVLGINHGRLGFLTDILPTELEKIQSILRGDYQLEKRFLLKATVHHEGTLLGTLDALNEVALIPDFVPHMNEFEVYIDDQFVCSQDSDGVIVATPTGSTAYALSGGGPILSPKIDAVVIVPMFAHMLSMRPIVIDANSEIKLIISPQNSATPRITSDGQIFINTPPGSHIHIRKNVKYLHLIHPLDYDYYTALRSKLHWGKKLHHSK